MDEHMAEALGSLTTGIYVLTTGHLDEPYGMVVSWVSPVSYDPPLVSAAIRTNRFLHDLIIRFDRFGLNVLASGEEEPMKAFKKSPPEARFGSLELFAGNTGAPILKEALAWLDCRLVETVRPGDHTLFIGRIEDGRRMRAGAPFTSLEYGHAYLGKY
jgi:flavin reductase (DIM6/NTAB) family NADH-FMN oxidoreductase RutF